MVFIFFYPIPKSQWPQPPATDKILQQDATSVCCSARKDLENNAIASKCAVVQEQIVQRSINEVCVCVCAVVEATIIQPTIKCNACEHGQYLTPPVRSSPGVTAVLATLVCCHGGPSVTRRPCTTGDGSRMLRSDGATSACNEFGVVRSRDFYPLVMSK